MKNRIFEIILVIALAMGAYACWPETKQAGQVNIPLYTSGLGMEKDYVVLGLEEEQ